MHTPDNIKSAGYSTVQHTYATRVMTSSIVVTKYIPLRNGASAQREKVTQPSTRVVAPPAYTSWMATATGMQQLCHPTLVIYSAARTAEPPKNERTPRLSSPPTKRSWGWSAGPELVGK